MRTDGDKAAAVRERIDRTRAEMSRTVDRIEERLSPANLKEQVAEVKDSILEHYRDAKNQVKQDLSREVEQTKMAVRNATVGRVENMVQSARDAGTSVVDTIRDNPVPSAMIALGLGWLFMGKRKRSSERIGVRADGGDGGSRVRSAVASAGEKLQEGASDLAERAGHVLEETRETAAHVVDEARETGSRVVERGERQLSRARAGVERTFRDNPLALGAIALAVGAGLGLVLPHTEAEDQWMGTTKDRLRERAEGAAHEALQKAEEKIGALTGGAATEQGSEQPSETPT